MNTHSGHFVAVIGGACAGSEAAFRLASRGIYVAVFEQQALPHGKIEDGLPKWHIKLRDKEENKINGKISHPNIFYVPNTRLGREISFTELVQDWGFSAVLLASGAWRDRSLPLPGIDAFHGKGFYYQNHFVDWFNHYHEPEYDRHQCEIADNAIVIGGGLASIDVVKILMLETTNQALKAAGHDADVISLEHRGIPKKLDELDVKFNNLGINGCTLYYRRRAVDMPLASLPDDPAKHDKAREVRVRILNNAREKYLFHFQECCKPIDVIEKNGRLAGIVFQRTEVADGRVRSVPNSEFKVHSKLVISSIGSVPEHLAGIPAVGDLFDVKDQNTGQLNHFENVFALGNAVTGRGNIRESELHARQVARHVMDEFLSWREDDHEKALETGWSILDGLPIRHVRSEDQIKGIMAKIRMHQQRAGYDGHFEAWFERHRPTRLEELLDR